VGLEKASILNLETKRAYDVLFNPEQYTVNQGNNFAPINVPGLSSPLLQFSHGELRTLQMDLFFDSREGHSVANRKRTTAGGDLGQELDAFLGLMKIDPETHAPPRLLFSWGWLQFRCVLASANQRVTMFREDGCPLRATVSATFNEYTNPVVEAKEVRRQTADYTKLHQVVEGETLAGIAYASYGDAALWRPIALRNGISDPGRLARGQRLVIPKLPYRAPGSDVVFQ
jgi:hypothetical protein